MIGLGSHDVIIPKQRVARYNLYIINHQTLCVLPEPVCPSASSPQVGLPRASSPAVREPGGRPVLGA
jgi:hypothetical protein